MSTCDYPAHVWYPQYGVAPHRHERLVEKDGTVKFLTIAIPEEDWPDNFSPDPEAGEMKITGTYYCPKCKEGMPDERRQEG